MIADWRLQWSRLSNGTTSPSFPFGFVQLNGNGATPTFNNPPEAPGGDYSAAYGFAGLRWSQTAGYGYAPNPRMPNTFMAVAMDTPNPTGGVHSGFKRPVGSRLARAGLAQAYSVPVKGLTARVASVGKVTGSSDGGGDGGGGTVTVTLSGAGGAGGVALHNDTGFEVLVRPNTSALGQWFSTPIIGHTATTVTVGNVPAAALRIRYEWYGNACGLSLFGCAVYTNVAPLPGGFDGALPFLPLAPFVAAIPSAAKDRHVRQHRLAIEVT